LLKSVVLTIYTVQIREISFAFQEKLGLTLAINHKADAMSPATVLSIQRPENCEGIFCGDSVSRVNGQGVSGMTFSGTVA
jgi:hypothetical protein